MTRVEFEVRGAARDLFLCRTPEVCIAGSAGTGKSNAALMRLHLAALTYPGMRGLILRKTAVSLTGSTLVTFNKKIIKEALAAGLVKWYGGSVREPAAYRYINGSEINVGGLNDPTKIMSTEYDLVFVDEATEVTVGDWESIGTRLRNGVMPWQQQIAACNPGAPTHWIKQRSNEGQLRLLTSTHADNPAYTNPDGTYTDAGAAYMRILDGLTGVRRLRLKDGIWAAAEGLIYGGWNEAVHLIDDFEIPSTWPRFWSVDFGFTNPMVVQFWAQDPDGRLYLYRELYRTQTLVEDMAKLILSYVTNRDGTWKEPKPRAIICDHDAEDRATLEKHLKMTTRPADKRVSLGIQAVQARLKTAGDGKGRLFIMRGARVRPDHRLKTVKKPTSTVEEITEYVWDTLPASRQGGTEKETPRKENDHGCLVAGTLVSTPAGAVPIQDVRAGDIVLTRHGARSVVAAGMTQARARIFRAALSNGSVLEGTGDHPVWVSGRGWSRLDALRYGDILEACRQLMPSDMAGSSSAVTPTPRTGPKPTTTSPASPTDVAAHDASMRRSGSPTTGRSRTATRSTTSTTTPSTTIPETCTASPSPTTRKPTGIGGANELQALKTWHTSNASDLSPHTGTAARPVASGTANTPSVRASATIPTAMKSAITAEASTEPGRSEEPPASVPTTARWRTARRAVSTTSSASAWCAESNTRSTSTPRPGLADVAVVAVYALSDEAAVYNLTVDGVPEFYANGVLVHNCDAARYLVLHRDPPRRGKGGIRTPHG